MGRRLFASSSSDSSKSHLSLSSTGHVDESIPSIQVIPRYITHFIDTLDNENEDQNQNDNENSANDDEVSLRSPYAPRFVNRAPRTVDENTDEANAQSEDQNSAYIIDPSQTIVIHTIDGVVVPHRRCYLKICGIRIFDDKFPYKINLKLLPIILIIIVISSILGGSLNSSRKQSSTIIPSSSPSNSSSTVPDIRVVNITETLFNISGPSILETNTPQNKAFTWILHEDGMNLTYSSPNLVQRYALMVMYHSLSGEEWFNNEGYGSDQSECEWFGIECKINQVFRINHESNGLVGELVKEIGLFSRLHFMILRGNLISGGMPTEIGMLARLERLDVSENNLSGSIPDEMRNCRNLQRIYTESNMISGTIPSFLEELQLLQTINFRRNQLTGTIPSNLSKLAILVNLVFFDNKLTGTIPPELGSCELLEFLDLGRNSLTDTIPSTLGNLALLKTLYLEKNILTGTIPEELGNLSKLDILSIDSNNLGSTIPETLGSLTKLTEVYLSNNMINGTIPLSFDNLDDLDIIHLHHNMISGTLSEKVCGFSFSELTADCVGMEAEVSCSCCTECY